MGKTIQTIALLLAAKEGKGKRKKQSSNTCPATLIIVPTSALMQWAEEIRNFTKPGALSCFIYYGDRSHVKRDDFYKHDVVITTYPSSKWSTEKLLIL